MPEDKRSEMIGGWFDLLKGLVPHGSTVELPVLSGSMAPLILPGNAIRIRSISPAGIRAGDIIVFSEKNSLTTHRLLVRIPLRGTALLYQKGDANRFGSWIKDSRVVGIVDVIRDDEGAHHDLFSAAARNDATKAARRHMALAAWNTVLILPRFIKKCLTQK